LEPKFAVRDWIHRGRRAKNECFQILAIAMLAGATGFFLIGGKESDQARAGKGVTTETAATDAGAQVTPREPKLRVEPK
jgi:hypothetical protein